MSTGKAGHAEDQFLAVNVILPDASVVLFAGNSSRLLRLTLLLRLQKAFDKKRLMTCSAMYARYQQLHNMRMHTDSTLCTVEKLIHRCVLLMSVNPDFWVPASNAETFSLAGS